MCVGGRLKRFYCNCLVGYDYSPEFSGFYLLPILISVHIGQNHDLICLKIKDRNIEIDSNRRIVLCTG